jgi:hypothetical protein
MNDDRSRLPGVWKADAMRVEPVSRRARKRRLAGGRDTTGRVQRVADQGMSCRREVNPDLVRPPGPDLDLDEGALGALLDEANPGTGALSGRVHCVDGSEQGMRHGADGKIDDPLARGKGSLHDPPVSAFDVALPAANESPAGFALEREEHDSGSASSEAMERRGARIPPAHAMEERVLDEASAGERGQSRRLRDGEDVSILVQHREARGCARLAPGRAVPDQGFSHRELPSGSRRNSFDQNQALLDPLLPFERRRMRIAFAQVSQ